MERDPKQRDDDQLISDLREDMHKLGRNPVEDDLPVELGPAGDEDYQPGPGMG